MLVAQNSLGPVCPVPLTVRGKREDLDRRLDDGARDHAAPTFSHGLRPALNGFEAVSAGEESEEYDAAHLRES